MGEVRRVLPKFGFWGVAVVTLSLAVVFYQNWSPYIHPELGENASPMPHLEEKIHLGISDVVSNDPCLGDGGSALRIKLPPSFVGPVDLSIEAEREVVPMDVATAASDEVLAQDVIAGKKLRFGPLRIPSVVGDCQGERAEANEILICLGERLEGYTSISAKDLGSGQVAASHELMMNRSCAQGPMDVGL